MIVVVIVLSVLRVAAGRNYDEADGELSFISLCVHRVVMKRDTGAEVADPDVDCILNLR